MSAQWTHCARGCGMGWGSATEVGDKVLAPHRVGGVNVDIVFDPLRNRSKMFNAALLNLCL